MAPKAPRTTPRTETQRRCVGAFARLIDGPEAPPTCQRSNALARREPARFLGAVRVSSSRDV